MSWTHNFINLKLKTEIKMLTSSYENKTEVNAYNN